MISSSACDTLAPLPPSRSAACARRSSGSDSDGCRRRAPGTRAGRRARGRARGARCGAPARAARTRRPGWRPCAPDAWNVMREPCSADVDVVAASSTRRSRPPSRPAPGPRSTARSGTMNSRRATGALPKQPQRLVLRHGTEVRLVAQRRDFTCTHYTTASRSCSLPRADCVDGNFALDAVLSRADDDLAARKRRGRSEVSARMPCDQALTGRSRSGEQAREPVVQPDSLEQHRVWVPRAARSTVWSDGNGEFGRTDPERGVPRALFAAGCEGSEQSAWLFRGWSRGVERSA